MSFLVQFFIVRGPSCRSLLQYGIDSFQNMSSVTQHTLSDCNLGWLQSFIFLGLRRQWWTALVVQSNQTLNISFLMLLLVLAGLHVSKCDFGLVAECDFGLGRIVSRLCWWTANSVELYILFSRWLVWTCPHDRHIELRRATPLGGQMEQPRVIFSILTLL